MDYENEIIQYFVINRDLNMDAGKVAAQVAHAATISTINMVSAKNCQFPDYFDYFVEWYQSGMSKIVLKGTEGELHKLKENGFYVIRDRSFLEVPEGALTVISLPPMPRIIGERFIGDFPLY
ncbi:aminoacyl-tRNA hydrolase [Robertmurraya andreesenii]|uniref:peptidyl-tRNA hydrolase n=1 Tax=Anoxybacillus andreesenii TaxID=1325932 RepID=A0ABT9V6S6_9BACL|nr:aminoacyl-tRNA hydrolase [Robertmurraya andreesenii]MDQ0156654.1 peptidyl-tRNA hydrolase [Robertmurraya andreesenii]